MTLTALLSRLRPPSDGWHVATLSGVPLRTTPFSVLVSALTIAIWSNALRGLLDDDAPFVAALAFAVVVYLMLVASLLFHEFAHVLSARAFGNGCRGIVLTPFGMMADLQREAATPYEEAVVVGIGPLSSLALALPLWFLGDLPGTTGLLAYVAFVLNVAIAVFNMIPCYPMDGGRLLRAAAWAWTGDILRGTTFAARVGWLGALLIAANGVRVFLNGNPLGVLWVALAFLMVAGTSRHLAQMRQAAIRTAGRIMRPFGFAESNDGLHVGIAPGGDPVSGGAAIEIRRGAGGERIGFVPASSMPRVRREAGPVEMMEAFSSVPAPEWPILLVGEGEPVGYVTQGQVRSLLA